MVARRSSNDRGNKNLFVDAPTTGRLGKALSSSGVSAASNSSGPINYNKFVDMVKKLQED